MAIEIPKFIKPPGISIGAINSNTTTAKGLELLIMKINAFIKSAAASSDSIIYGKYELQGEENISDIRKALDRGVLKILDEIGSIDFCNIFSYLVNNNPRGKKFDPKKFPEDGTNAEKTLWKVQYKAYKLQSKIDKYYATWGSLQGQDTRSGLIELIREINIVCTELLQASSELNDPEIKGTFPELSIASNFIQNINIKFNGYVISGIIPEQDIRSIIDFIEKLKVFLSTIQALTIPKNSEDVSSNLLVAVDLVVGNRIQEQIYELNKIVAPKKAPKFLKDLLNEVLKISSIGKKIISYIRIIKVFIKLLLLLIKVFYILRRFFTGLPIPSLLTPVGGIVTISDLNEQVLKRNGIFKFIARLQQINILLGSIISFASGLISVMDAIILKLRAIILNIESCNQELADEIIKTIDDLQNTKNDLQNFINEANEAKERVDNTFGGYTIEIITEQVTDEGISLKRRYGIARGPNNVIAVQSTPTFASLDLIIINEVKVLLVSAGLVTTPVFGLSPQDTVTIMDAMNYLGNDNDIDFNFDQIANITSEFNETNDDIGLTSFVNNLPGGKSLRNKVRNNLIKERQKLKDNLKSTDPNSKYTSNIIQN